ncbi:MAG: aminotransferase class V-fold PLP-dependent enzyme [Sandaracinaceae bacterium]|nr:aminotransferase class V-fold PLP-dependent enzyme [Sandaracinaceae bacterium]
MTRPVYMDCHSTTPVDARVLEAMLPYFTERFGNAASRSHAFGWEAEEAVEAARAQVAASIGGRAKDLVFTSGATEADNLAIKGVVEAAGPGAHVITQVTEHKAVLDSCKHVERLGGHVTYLPVDGDGRVDPGDVERAITDRTALISVMHVNNEVGTVQPIAELGRVAKARGVPLHCDAAQGSLFAFDVEAMGVDLVSLSAHKMYGPKGVGALWVRRRQPRVALVAQMDGGGHERGRRSGTLDVPSIVGFGEAARLAAAERDADAAHAAALRDRLRAKLEAELDDVHLNGPEPAAGRHPGNLNLSFAYVEAEALMLALKDVVAVSSGSACTSASLEPSYVLRALGIDEDRAHASIRFGLGRLNTADEVDSVADAVVSHVKRLRELSPLYRLHREGTSVDW